MNELNFKAEVLGSADDVIARVSDELKKEGFGILTRIDLHKKFQEKLGKKIQPAVILGACNPQLAYDAYQFNTDVASLLPCNAVVREVSEGRCSVELVRPSAMMQMFDDEKLIELSRDADSRLERCLNRLTVSGAG